MGISFLKILVVVLFLFAASANAEILKLVTGEYAPFSGEKLSQGGISTQVVKAVFNEVNQDVTVEFIPWNRAMNYLKNGAVAGSFPWTKNDEREAIMYFSDPIHLYQMISFVKKGTDLEKNFTLVGKKICLASGWNDAFLKKFDADKMKYTIERPINMESCFQMLALGRVDIVSMNEYVGRDLAAKIFPKASPIVGLKNKYFDDGLGLYFIIPKIYPNSKKILSEFNRGLKIIKNNGKYNLIVKDLLKRESFRSSCVTCNQLGSL